MGAGFEASDVFGEVRSQGKRAWHGLGDEIPAGLKTWPAFQQIKMDWETELLPCFATYKGEDNKVKQFKLDEVMAHVRKDTKQLLAVVSAGYKPISNKTLAEFTDSLVETGAGVTVETAGTLLDGKVVFTLVRLPQDIQVTDEDILQQYVLVRSSHDCSTAFRVYPTSIRVVCANTLRMSEGDQARGIACWHTGDIMNKIEHARLALGIISKTTTRFAAQVRLLAARSLTTEQVKEYFCSVYDTTYGVKPEFADEGNEKAKAKFERQMERRDDILNVWTANLENKEQTLKGIQGTAWAAYNAVSQYHDHMRGRFGPVTESNGRIHSNLFGAADAAKQIAFDRALVLVK
jgi:phage/plasmid-like protein (TIGR03299 family)